MPESQTIKVSKDVGDQLRQSCRYLETLSLDSPRCRQYPGSHRQLRCTSYSSQLELEVTFFREIFSQNSASRVSFLGKGLKRLDVSAQLEHARLGVSDDCHASALPSWNLTGFTVKPLVFGVF